MITARFGGSLRGWQATRGSKRATPILGAPAGTADPGVIEAARAAGAGPVSILITVVVPEALGPLILDFTFVAVVEMSAQSGLFGGGRLRDFAISYGSQHHNWPVVYVSVAIIIVIVQAGQFLGNWLARRALRR